MKRFIILFLLLSLSSFSQKTQKTSQALSWKVTMGFNFGATSPVPKPSEITKIYVWYPKINPSFMVTTIQRFNEKAKGGMAFSFIMERKGFSTTTQADKLPMTVEGEKMFFSGDQNTTFDSTYLGAMMAYTHSLANNKVEVYSGLYMNLLINSDFIIKLDGDGKVSTGDESTALNAGTIVTQVFSDQIAPMEMGIVVGSDILITRNIGVSLKFTGGLTTITKEEFNKLIGQGLYNFYGFLGINYRFN